jgi:hypothetical protein
MSQATQKAEDVRLFWNHVKHAAYMDRSVELQQGRDMD